ncbi:MAG: zinc ribbon domain-containing protein [Methanomassiliicoccus sp.]|nr:zinc ribbon domain-containing protein [Methanomassiliicoccus sp.]
MTYCRRCGNSLEEHALYCPHCGTAVRDPLPPPLMYPPVARKSDGPWKIVVAVVVVMIVVPVLLSGLLYFMVVGFGSSGPSPSADLLVTKPSADLINFAVRGTTTEVDLSEVWIDVRSPDGQFGMNAGQGLEAENRSLGGNGNILAIYYDMDADRKLSANDKVVISSTLGPLEYGRYEVRLEHRPTGAVIANVAVTVP